MKRLILSTTLSFALASVLMASENLSVHPGWQLLGSSNEVQDVTSTFSSSNIKFVWVFDDTAQKWKAYSPDSNLMQVINDSDNVETLSYIAPNKGFWINATGYETIILNDNSNTNPEQNGFRFVDKLKDVNLSSFANKTFKILNYYNDFYEDSKAPLFKSITFDQNGNAKLSFSYKHCYDDNDNDTNITIDYKINNGTLVVSDDYNNSMEYKILATNDNGVVLGSTMANRYGPMWKANNSILVFLNDNVTQQPVDMSSIILPFKVYDTWDNDSYTELDSNGSIVYHYNDMANDVDDDSFKIVDGKINIYHSQKWNDGGFEDNSTIQTIYQIGRYNIDKINYSEYHYDTVIHIDDANGSSFDFNLTAHPDIDTWQKLFNETNWTLYNTKYYENNNTTEYGETFTISSDGKTLSTTHECGEEDNQTIGNGMIYDKYSGVWMDITSLSPIYKPSTNSSARVLNKAKHHRKRPLWFLPEKIRRNILRDR